jgi:sec-independent protein translocase protein TatA
LSATLGASPRGIAGWCAELVPTGFRIGELKVGEDGRARTEPIVLFGRMWVMPFGIGITEMLILLLVVLVVFGPKRLPEMGRQLGKGMREFKETISGDRDDLDVEAPSSRPVVIAIDDSVIDGDSSVLAPAERVVVPVVVDSRHKLSA